MSVLANRKTVMAVVIESTAGTPAWPVSGGNFVALQEGFTMNPANETEPNLELTPSIDEKAPINIKENPASTVGHYYRNSGAVATAPNYDVLLEASLGTKTAAIAELTISGGSTSGNDSAAGVLLVNASGNLLDRGSVAFIKDSVNTYSMRNVLSVSGNAITLLHNLGVPAPAAGVKLGRPTKYSPNDTLPSLSQFLFRANGGAIELMTGARVNKMSLVAEANKSLNMKFDLAGTGYYFDPILVASNQRYLDFDDGTARVAVVAAQTYKSPHELAAALEVAMNAAGSSDEFTVKFNDTGTSKGKFTISTDGSTLELLHNTGANTANKIGAVLGFLVAADDTGSLSYTSDAEQDWAADFSRTDDANVQPLIVKNNEVLFGTFERTICSQVQSFTADLSNTLQDVPDICAVGGILEKRSTKRSTEIKIKMSMSKHDADVYEKFRTGDIVAFTYNGGIKVGGNWVEGRCVNFCVPEAKVVSFEVKDDQDIVVIEATLKSEANSSGLGSVYASVV